jgi:hypothetical protein
VRPCKCLPEGRTAEQPLELEATSDCSIAEIYQESQARKPDSAE